MDSPWYFALLTGLAGCLGWGIRGVFGHQMGAMVPGAMMGAALAVAGGMGYGWAQGLLLAAVGAAGFSIGGIESYGQTLGLMHGPERDRRYWWGFLGCFVKGGLWWGIGGALLALVPDGDSLRAGHVAVMAGLATGAGMLGKRLLNDPLGPPHRYPLIYFSHRATDEEDLERNPPRQEYWGALLLGLLVIVAYGRFVLGSHGVPFMALTGLLGGGIGFSVGEALQAWGSWRKPFGERVQPWVDWWKVMEMSFGLIGGAAIGLAWWLAYGCWPWQEGKVEVWPVTVEEWPQVLFAGWLVLALAAADGRPFAQRLRGVPLLSGMLLVAGLSSGDAVARVLLWGFLTYITGATNLQRWRRQVRQRACAGWHAALVVASLALALCACQFGGAREDWPALQFAEGWEWGWAADPRAILLATALIQTLFTFSHALAERGPGGFRERLSRMGSAWSVEVGFVVLCGLLAWVVSMHP